MRTPILAATLAAALAPTAGAQILGVTWDGDAVSVAPGTGEVTLIGPTGFEFLNAMARDANGRIVATNKAAGDPGQVIEIDPETGDGTVLTISLINDVRAIAFDPDDPNLLLAVEAFGGIRKKLWRVDLTKKAGVEGFKTLLGDLNLTGMAGLTYAPDGTLLGWSTAWGLVVVDLGPAGEGPPNVIDVNALQDGTSDIQTLAFSPSTGRLYGMHQGLYVIDPGTGDYEQIAHDEDVAVRGLEFVNACPADVDRSGTLDVLDFVAMQGAFVAGDPVADCDENGVLNVLDFVCFQALFVAGCP